MLGEGGITLGDLAEEVRLWNTPAVGAYLLWKFTTGYCSEHSSGEAPIGLLHFIATAILTNKDLIKPISNQRDNLQSYIRSFDNSKTKSSDLLLNIHERIYAKREYTLASLDFAVANGLLVWDFETGKLYPRAIDKKPSRGKALKPCFEQDGKKAEILGKWFSQHSLATIAVYLKVAF